MAIPLETARWVDLGIVAMGPKYRLTMKNQSLLNVNIELPHTQIIVAKNMFQNLNSTMEMYKQLSAMPCAFPDLRVLFKLALTVPIASISAERRFSVIR
jgi:hypothetical protein